MRVTKIRDVNGTEDLYDLTVHGTANFALECGIYSSNSPAHTVPWDSELRDIYIKKWSDGIKIHADYSQMEVRALAAISKEESLLKAYEAGVDIHRMIASQVFSKSQDQVTDTERRFSKMAVFSILYGKSSRGFGIDFLNGDILKAESIFNGFFDSFPKVRDYVDSCHKQLFDKGYVNTIFGDRIYIPFDRGDRKSENAAKRLSQNYPIQSSASNVAGYGIYNTAEALYNLGVVSNFEAFTHDSIDLEARCEDILKITDTMIEHMEKGINSEFGLPVKVDYEIGLSGNKMLGLDIEELDPDHLVASFSAKVDDYEEISNYLKAKLGEKVEFEVSGETKKQYHPKRDIFANKRAYSLVFGTNYETLNGKIKLFA